MGDEVLKESNIKKLLGEKYPFYQDLVHFIKENYQIEGINKYSKKSGWTVFFKKSGKSLCYINLQEGMFQTTVVIGSSLVDEVKDLSLSTDTINLFKEAKVFYDGKWLFFEKNTKDEIEDIKKLLILKKKPSKS